MMDTCLGTMEMTRRGALLSLANGTLIHENDHFQASIQDAWKWHVDAIHRYI
jgi:hypothetical protein